MSARGAICDVLGLDWDWGAAWLLKEEVCVVTVTAKPMTGFAGQKSRLGEHPAASRVRTCRIPCGYCGGTPRRGRTIDTKL